MKQIKDWDSLPLLIDIPLLCQLIGARDCTIRKYIQDRKIPYVQLGGEKGAILFKKEDVIAWIDQHRVPMREGNNGKN